MDIDNVLQSLSKNKITFPIHPNHYEQSVDYYQRPLKPFIPPDLMEGISGEAEYGAVSEEAPDPHLAAPPQHEQTLPCHGHSHVNMIALAMGMKACKEWVPFLQMSHADMLHAFAKHLKVAIVVHYGPGVYNMWDEGEECIVLSYQKTLGNWSLGQKKGLPKLLPPYPPLTSLKDLKKMVLKDILPWAEACGVSCTNEQGKKRLKAELVDDLRQHIERLSP